MDEFWTFLNTNAAIVGILGTAGGFLSGLKLSQTNLNFKINSLELLLGTKISNVELYCKSLQEDYKELKQKIDKIDKKLDSTQEMMFSFKEALMNLKYDLKEIYNIQHIDQNKNIKRND